ncbi:MAG: sulfatase-like hydrolase/transferase [Acidobacteriota bacterium]
MKRISFRFNHRFIAFFFASTIILGPSDLLFCSEIGETPERAHPDILLITLDTTRADHLGCYGASFAQTPNLDSLAKAGTRFDNAFSPAPLTLPSHASMLTGLIPRRHSVRDNALFRLNESIPTLTERLKEAGYRTAAFVSAAILDRVTGINRGFDHYDDNVRVGERQFFNYEERAATQVTDAVLSYLSSLLASSSPSLSTSSREYRREPLFLWVHYFDPHLPYVPPEPFKGSFKDRPYDGEIAFMDHEIGRLLEAARKKLRGKVIEKRKENAEEGKDTSAYGPLIIVAGDHGESLGEHGERAHDVFIYNATQRVPLILHGAGVSSGRVVKRNVGLVDIAPTILEIVDLPPLKEIDGQSLLPLLRGQNVVLPDYEMESFFPYFSYGWAPLRGIVRKNLKYIDAPQAELYDLSSDTSEKQNLIFLKKREGERLAEAVRRIASIDPLETRKIDAELLELRRRMESLGYIGGSRGGALPHIDPKEGIKWIEDLEMARRELQIGDPKKGILLLDNLLTRNPENVPAAIALAQCHLASGNIEQSITLCRRLVSDRPDNDIPHLNLAIALKEKWRNDQIHQKEARVEAQAEFEQVLKLNPRHAEAYLAYYSMLILDEKLYEAHQLLKRAKQEGVSDPDVEVELGYLEMAHGEAALARGAFERAVTLNPRAAKALEGLGRIAYAEGKFRLSADYYERALDSSPSASLAKTLGSILLLYLNDPAGARAAYLKAVELLPPDDPSLPELQEIIKTLLSEERK